MSPAFVTSGDGGVRLVGNWTVSGLREAQPAFTPKGEPAALRFDLSEVKELDSFGAAAFVETVEELRQSGVSVHISGADTRQSRLIDSVSANPEEDEGLSPERIFSVPLSSLGRSVVEAGRDAADIAEVQGRFIASAFRIITFRGPVRFAAVVNQFHDIILRAIPIVALISLVVGIILTQQSIAQLRTFGATIFVVDLGGILMLREIGVLLAAIMVAGRSGSAITAEIGAMKMREEIDALEVMGLDTYRAVVMPRAIALIAGMPALAFIGAIAGILGAALVARIAGGVSLENFTARLSNVLDLHVMMVGVIKAPFMALAIGVIAVSEGLQVSGSTQSLGRHTTASVVKSIFMVIVLDGVFAIFFEAIGF